MGRMYTVSAIVAGVAAAIDILEINAPTDSTVFIHKIIVTQESEFGDAQAEQLDIIIHRGTAGGSVGATPTAAPTATGTPAFGGTCETGNTTQDTEGTVLHREAVPAVAGFYYTPTPEERFEVSPGDRIICELATDPDDSIDFRVTAYFEAVGG